jgi:hypothetical protein
MIGGLLSLLFFLFLFSKTFALSWESAFKTQSAAKNVHFIAKYIDRNGKIHQLEYWRVSDKKLKRSTDGKVEIYAFKTKEGDYQYLILDKQRSTLLKISRTNLYRLGAFYDWYSLAHILKRPVSYRIEKLDKKPYSLGNYSCKWYLVSEPSQTYSVCWSEKLAIPLLIQDDKNKTVWEVQKVATEHIGDNVFSIHKKDLVELDVDEELSPE